MRKILFLKHENQAGSRRRGWRRTPLQSLSEIQPPTCSRRRVGSRFWPRLGGYSSGLLWGTGDGARGGWGGLDGGGVKCFQRQLFGFGSRGGDQSLRVGRQRAEAERGMDPGLRSLLPGPPLPPPPAPHGLRPRPVRGRGDCVRARACAQAGEGEARGAPGLAGVAGWGHLAEPGAASVCGGARFRACAFARVCVRVSVSHGVGGGEGSARAVGARGSRTGCVCIS